MAKRGSKSRKLTAQEQSLWQKVTKDVVGQPSQKSLGQESMQVEMPAIDKLALVKTTPSSARKRLKSSASRLEKTTQPQVKLSAADKGYLVKLMQKFDDNNHPAHQTTPKASPTRDHYAPQIHQEKPQNLPLDRNIRQKLQRGRADIEASLDLHGFNRDNAEMRLMSFLKSSYQQAFKTVIVVTGKGDGSIARHSLHSADFFQMPEQRAVLRASIADWLNSAEAAQYVIGWQPAHPKHGGGGAVYVRLRSRKR